MFSHAGEGQDAALWPDLANPLSVYHAVNLDPDSVDNHRVVTRSVTRPGERTSGPDVDPPAADSNLLGVRLRRGCPRESGMVPPGCEQRGPVQALQPGDSGLDVHSLDHVLREIEVCLGRLRIREDDRDEPRAGNVEDVQVPAVGGPLCVKARS